ncbi:hypothetical protein D3C72_647660 [compost metagenome]
MTRILPMAWGYQAISDPQARLGVHTTLVVRTDGGGYTVLGVFPGPELADRFLETLSVAPHESLFDGPTMIGPGYEGPSRPSPPGPAKEAEPCRRPSTPMPPSST